MKTLKTCPVQNLDDFSAKKEEGGSAKTHTNKESNNLNSSKLYTSYPYSEVLKYGAFHLQGDTMQFSFKDFFC